MVMESTALPSPFRRLQQLLWEDKKDLALLLLYSTISGVLSLMLPIASQALINIIASGVFLQPLIILSLLVFVGLGFTGVVRIVEMTLLEILQQRLFVRITLYLAKHLPQVDSQVWNEAYPPERVNRFFETTTLQKSLTKVLLEFPAALLQIVISLIFMGFYSPYFLFFNAFLVAGGLGFLLLGKTGVTSSLVECKYKYEMAHLLQDLARCHSAFKIYVAQCFGMKEVDALCTTYVTARRRHFNVVIRQASWSFFVNTAATAGLLALGGWLVMKKDISIGQLVAAELMMLLLLAAVTKIVSNIESWYDLLTSIDKLGTLTDLPNEVERGVDYIDTGKGIEVNLQQVSFQYPQQPFPLFQHLNLVFKSGSRTAIVGTSGAGKSTLAQLILGLLQPNAGAVQINQQQLRDLQLSHFRQHVSLVGSHTAIFKGTLRDNILMGREFLGEAALKRALDISGLSTVLDTLPQGLDMPLGSEGLNLSSGKRQMLMLARSLLASPALLILDEAFHHIEGPLRRQILEKLTAPEEKWTLIFITHDAEVLRACEDAYLFHEGNVMSQGSIPSLLAKEDPFFQSFFPAFVYRDRTGEGN
jgi:ABC-type bacteriocin/lantibiotic exporter with double-glycine peptidase domain